MRFSVLTLTILLCCVAGCFLEERPSNGITPTTCSTSSDCGGEACLGGICVGNLTSCSEGTCGSEEGCLLDLQSHCDGCKTDTGCVSLGFCESQERECLPGRTYETPNDVGSEVD